MIINSSASPSISQFRLIAVLCCGVNFLVSPSATSREIGHYVPGVANIRDLAVPAAPGFYYEQYNTYYTTDTYRDRNGDRRDSFELGDVPIELEADVDVVAVTPVLLWATEHNVLGGDYAFYIAPSIGHSSVASALSVLGEDVNADSSGTGLGDMFIQPLFLGWRGTQYDLSLGIGAYLPVGKYDADDDDNIGLGFWTGQAQVATYYYLDESQASALMLAATWETHGEKDGTDVTPGDHVTIEYGFSQYLSPRLEVGVAGFYQWQIERDKRPTSLIDPNAKGEIGGIGVQAAYWIAPQFNVSFKYMKEYGAKARFEGDWYSVNLTWVPSPIF
jgi:hypothetical protein